MKIYIDGKEIPCKYTVKVIYDSVVVDPDTQRKGDLQIQLTRAGIIADTYCNDDPYKSMWKDTDTIVAECR